MALAVCHLWHKTRRTKTELYSIVNDGSQMFQQEGILHWALGRDRLGEEGGVLPQPLHKTTFSTFFNSTGPCSNQNHKIFLNFQFNMSNFGKFSVPIPKNWSESNSEASIWAKNQFWKQHFVKKVSSTSLQIWAQSVLQAPIFGPSGCKETCTETKVEYPSLG